ncbi:hypothetical protein ACFVVM_21365 [Nocardia sp. NPDC058176]|uniref:hypothetical protein n=1 Tax=Nocardia sp. NPDC058176 TaxID=3346368 RepID=UPI0036DBF11C
MPTPIPVRITVHDLATAPDAPRGVAVERVVTRSEVEIIIRAGATRARPVTAGAGSGSTELSDVLREVLQDLTAAQRVPAPRPLR